MHIKAQIFRGFHLCHNYSSILFFNYRQKESVTIHPADVILFEGILTIYFKELRDLLDMKLFVDSDSDTRLSRRGLYNLWKLDISLITRMQSNVFGLEKVLYTPIISWWLCPSKRNSLQPCFSVKTTPQIQKNFFLWLILPSFVDRCEPSGWCASSAFYIKLADWMNFELNLSFLTYHLLWTDVNLLVGVLPPQHSISQWMILRTLIFK